jgi:hypothetical protein
MARGRLHRVIIVTVSVSYCPAGLRRAGFGLVILPHSSLGCRRMYVTEDALRRASGNVPASGFGADNVVTKSFRQNLGVDRIWARSGIVDREALCV